MAATNLASEEEGSTRIRKNNHDIWKFPKISVHQVYKYKLFQIFPSYAVKDFEETIILKPDNDNVSIQLLTRRSLKGLMKKQHRFMHFGLVQIAIKPLMRDGVGAQVVVCLRDVRILDFNNSLLALVDANLSKGPFYFHCFPSFSVPLADASSLEAIVMTSGIPLALTYRVVCKVMVDLNSKAVEELILGETTYFQPSAGTRSTTKWDELQVPESWTRKEPKQDGNLLETLPDGCMILRYPSNREEDDDDDEYESDE